MPNATAMFKEMRMLIPPSFAQRRAAVTYGLAILFFRGWYETARRNRGGNAAAVMRHCAYEVKSEPCR